MRLQISSSRDAGMVGNMDGFMYFSTIFQSYQDDGRLIMKASVLWGAV